MLSWIWLFGSAGRVGIHRPDPVAVPVRDPAADLREDARGLRRRLVRRTLGGVEGTRQGHEAHERDDDRERPRADPLVPLLPVAATDQRVHDVFGRNEPFPSTLEHLLRVTHLRSPTFRLSAARPCEARTRTVAALIPITRAASSEE